MHLCNFVLAATAWSIASTVAAAELQQTGGRNPSASPAAKPGLVLASAETASENPDEQASSDAQTPPAPAKRQRAARVTTCRCGDRGQ